MSASRIKRLLERRDRLAAQLRQVDQQIAREGRAYWQAKGCNVLPRPERLRAAVAEELAA